MGVVAAAAVIVGEGLGIRGLLALEVGFHVGDGVQESIFRGVLVDAALRDGL